MPIRDGRWLSAYADGNHACYFSFCCGVGMFFSFLLCCFFVFDIHIIARERSALPCYRPRGLTFFLRHLLASGCKVRKSFVNEQIVQRKMYASHTSSAPFACYCGTSLQLGQGLPSFVRLTLKQTSLPVLL